MKTVAEVREAFWAEFPEYAKERRTRKSQNDYRCDIRCAFVDFTDRLCQDGAISQTLATRVTL